MQFNIPTSYTAPQQQAPAVVPSDTPLCGGHQMPCVPKESGPASKNPGRFFWACGQKPYCKGWIGFVDEPVKGATESRKRAAVDQPAADNHTVTRIEALEKAMTDLIVYVRSLEGELKNVQASVYQGNNSE